MKEDLDAQARQGAEEAVRRHAQQRDDQQGSATALIAGLANALKVVGKSLPKVRIAMIGMGAANVSVYRLLKASGANPGSIVACDSKGTLHRGHRLRLCKPYTGDLARGRESRRCADRRDRTRRFSKPTEQLAGLPRGFQGRARCAREHDQRRDGARRSRRACTLRRGAWAQC